jgi:hypothetical protein
VFAWYGSIAREYAKSAWYRSQLYWHTYLGCSDRSKTRSVDIYLQIYSNATAKSAKKFLGELVEKAPFSILECQRLEIPLIVLPPRRPDYNGGVERGNRTFREDFYIK